MESVDQGFIEVSYKFSVPSGMSAFFRQVIGIKMLALLTSQ